MYINEEREEVNVIGERLTNITGARQTVYTYI